MPGNYSSFLVLSGAGQREVMEALFTLGKNLDNSSLTCSFVAVVPTGAFAVLQMPFSLFVSIEIQCHDLKPLVLASACLAQSAG